MDSYGFVSGALLIAKGWAVTPSTFKNRLLFYVITFCGVIIYYHWEAMVISYLAVRTIVLPFSSLEDLVTNTNFKVTLFYISYTV